MDYTQPIGDNSRAFLHVSGSDAPGFLQKLISQDIGFLKQNGILYSALLSPQGKYLFDFFIVALNDRGLLIDTNKDQAQPLLEKLALYRLRQQVEITPGKQWSVALCWGNTAKLQSSDLGICRQDPRDARLGMRCYHHQQERNHSNADISRYHELCVACMVPTYPYDLIPNDSYILEMDFARLNGVSFSKGCYIGQEVTARMRHKAKLKKGLCLAKFENSPPKSGEVVTDNERTVGRVGSVAGDCALLFLRLDKIGSRTLSAGSVKLHLQEAIREPA